MTPRRLIVRDGKDRPTAGMFRVLSWRDRGDGFSNEWWVEGDDHPTDAAAIAAATAIAATDGVQTLVIDDEGGKRFTSPLSEAQRLALRRPKAVTTLVERAFGQKSPKSSPTYKRR